MLDAARTLGWSNAKIFFKLMPAAVVVVHRGGHRAVVRARPSASSGATLFLAGNYLGITRTIPIAIYFEWMNGNTDVAIFWTVVIMAFSFVVILFINLWSRRTTSYRRGWKRNEPCHPERSAQRGVEGSRAAQAECLWEGIAEMSLEVNIRKSFSSFTLDVAFEAGDETLGFGRIGMREEPYHAMHRRHRDA